MSLDPIKENTKFKLGDSEAKAPSDLSDRDEVEKQAKKEADELGELQQVFYADARYALLVVLQGRDASGKDGTIRNVFSQVNPQGCIVSSFKRPTEEEMSHDFLWRVHERVPPRGMFGIFNRSHYEDILVPVVNGTLGKKGLDARISAINDFERLLTDNGVVILKFFLHISRDEQKERLMERLSDEKKNWKFRVGDLEDREKWPQFTEAYVEAIRRTSSDWAPWYLVPSNSKKVRNLLVARTIVRALKKLDLRYPKADPAVLALRID
jgi:PPK2 family polyphosphate:nucleotide phosphotransferase